ncbi:hypothetical protein UB39_13990 [Photobacterium angustum]|nr:hypothetical protein UB39_13990 [Photobacterium angustum]
MENLSTIIINQKLQFSSSDFVFEWLKNNYKILSNLTVVESENLFTMLLDRNNQLINLGIALYCPDQKLCSKLFSISDENIKKALLSGIGVTGQRLLYSWIDDYLEDLLSNFNEDLLAILLNNKNIPDRTLISLFEKKKQFKNIDEVKWITLCHYAARNERLTTPYESNSLDSLIQYNRVFESAWRLFELFPTTVFSANVLSVLGENLIVKKPYGMDVEKTIQRWRVEDQDPELFEHVREIVARLNDNGSDEFERYKDSDDVALRRNYYSNFRFPKVENIREFFKKDGDVFLDAALNNRLIFANPKYRDALREVCLEFKDFDDLYNYKFGQQQRKWEQLHPEWFECEVSGDLPYEEIEDNEVRLELRVEHLSKKVTELHKALLDIKVHDEGEKKNKS